MAVRIELNKRSFGEVGTQLRRFLGVRTPAAQRAAIAVAGARLAAAVRQNLSAPPIGGSAATHRDALADLDHPYAARHGSIQIEPSGGGAPGFGQRRLVVHTVSGALVSALTAKLDGDSFTLSVDARRAPHARYVFEGTRVMLPRDTLWATQSDPAVARSVRAALIGELRRGMGF